MDSLKTVNDILLSTLKGLNEDDITQLDKDNFNKIMEVTDKKVDVSKALIDNGLLALKVEEFKERSFSGEAPGVFK